MFKLKYRNNIGSVVEVNFDDYMDLVYFVADQKIGDDSVVDITLFGKTMTLFELADKVKTEIEEFKAAEAEEDDYCDDYDDEDDDWDEDDDDDYDYEEEDEDDDSDNVIAEIEALFNQLSV